MLIDWPDEACIRILQNTIPALGPDSRIVILDQILPLQGATFSCVSHDLSMMLFSGMDRTERQWRELLDKAGLLIVKLTLPSPEAGELSFDAMIEAVLK